MSTSRCLAPSAVRRAAVAARCSLLAAIAALLVLLPSTAGAAGGRAGHTGARAPTTFVLDSQSEWVVAPPAGAAGGAPPSSPFDLGLTARHAPAGAEVEVVLYPRLLSRYDFEKAVRSGPHDYPIATSTPVPLASLPADTRAAGVSLDLSVVQTASTGQGSQLGLGCVPSTGGGTCTGVYPVVVELRRPGGGVVRRFTTFLTYVAGKSAHPLELSWVVPLGARVSLASDPSNAATAIDGLPSPAVAQLESLISALHGAPSVPVTIDVSPESVQQLARSGSGRSAVATLAGLSSDPSTDEVLAAPYVPIDLGALAGAGEPTEIRAQMAAGATVLHRYHVTTTPTASTWVQNGPVGTDLARGLAQLGTSRLVVPDDTLASPPGVTSSGTWSSTFSLGLSRNEKTVHAAETDGFLDGQFVADHGDPALAASQLLADLAMVHFERPNTVAVRGLVAVPPPGWSPNPVFDHVLLAGLAQNPVVAPVTLSRFFATVSTGGARHLARSKPGPALTRSFARALSHARVRLSNFDSAVAKHPRIEGELDQLLLASEAATLPAHRRAAGVATVDRLLTGQLHLVKFATGKTFTLTARTGSIPITVQSNAPYTVVGRLSVKGNKFQFPRTDGRLIRLDHATTPSRVDVKARSSGDLPLHVTFTSPNGKLVFARKTFTVTSTATSLVGIVLTVVALAILLTWWARTWWSGRERRRARRGARIGEGAA